MELDRPHLRTNSCTSSTNSELFICFASRLSSSSMKISKSILSPGRARDPPVSLSSSLSRRLRTSGSIKGGQASPMFPTGGKKRGCNFENPEPSSPKVTCIGQVRVKTKKKAKQTRSLSRRRSGDVSFRKVEQANDMLSNTEENGHGRAQRYAPSNSSTHFQQPECLPHRNQRWVHLPVTICEALRAFGAEFSCLFPCRSSCSSTNEREKEEKVNAAREEGNGESSCGAVFARWFVALQDCEGRQGRQIELVVGGEDEKTEVREMTSTRSSRRHVFEDIEIKGDRIEVKGEGEEEEKARLSICIPPKNALLLMRCRSDPVKMASLTNRFWESGAPKNGDEHEDEDNEEDKDPQDYRDVKEGRLVYSEVANESVGEAEVDGTNAFERRFSTKVTGELENAEREANLGTEMRVNEDEKPDEAPYNDWEVEEMQMMEHYSMKDDDSEAEFSLVEPHGDEEVADERAKKAIRVTEGGGEESSCSSQSSSPGISDEQVLESDETNKEIPESLAVEISLEEEIEEKAEESTTKQEIQEAVLENNEEKETTTHQNYEPEHTEDQQKEEKNLGETTIAETEEGQESLNLQVLSENQEKHITEPRKNDQESSTSSNVLPDCLLLMMCEPKLSMEVSKETWVCSTDFVRWLPERQTKKPENASDEAKKKLSKDFNPGRHSALENKIQKQKTQQQQQQKQHLLQPPRSSCSLPAAAVSMATMIEQKLVNAVGYEPFVLTRCKSEPMRTAAAKLAPDSCFWNNRKLEPHRPATFGVGAAGVGF